MDSTDNAIAHLALFLALMWTAILGGAIAFGVIKLRRAFGNAWANSKGRAAMAASHRRAH